MMFQKDVVAPGRMRRKIRKPRILLLDCPLEYKKGENQTNVELTREEDWRAPPLVRSLLLLAFNPLGVCVMVYLVQSLHSMSCIKYSCPVLRINSSRVVYFKSELRHCWTRSRQQQRSALLRIIHYHACR